MFCGRLEAERTLFGALKLSWGLLKPEEQEALLDIAWFMKGQRWAWVQLHCGPSLLQRLCHLGLVQVKVLPLYYQDLLGEVEVAVMHDTMFFFCTEASAIGHPLQRLKLHADRSDSYGVLEQVRWPCLFKQRGYRGHLRVLLTAAQHVRK
jgi:hypothetical protein